jgi:hypothetical protein
VSINFLEGSIISGPREGAFLGGGPFGLGPKLGSGSDRQNRPSRGDLGSEILFLVTGVVQVGDHPRPPTGFGLGLAARG